jgi:hypothetical protein
VGKEKRVEKEGKKRREEAVGFCGVVLKKTLPLSIDAMW